MSTRAMRVIRRSNLSQSNCEQRLFPGITSPRVAAERNSTNQTQIQNEQRFFKKKAFQLVRLFCSFVLEQESH
jgi:uncharacterized membrane protein YjjP (DUF1212 family)